MQPALYPLSQLCTLLVELSEAIPLAFRSSSSSHPPQYFFLSQGVLCQGTCVENGGPLCRVLSSHLSVGFKDQTQSLQAVWQVLHPQTILLAP